MTRAKPAPLSDVDAAIRDTAIAIQTLTDIYEDLFAQRTTISEDDRKRLLTILAKHIGHIEAYVEALQGLKRAKSDSPIEGHPQIAPDPHQEQPSQP